MAVRAKHRKSASNVVEMMLQRAERRLQDQFLEDQKQLVEDAKQAHSALIKKANKLLAEYYEVAQELTKAGFNVHSYDKHVELNMRQLQLQERSKPLAKARDTKLKQLQTLELDVALLGVADDADLQKTTKDLIAKINAIAGA
jgi:hypothetical protein